MQNKTIRAAYVHLSNKDVETTKEILKGKVYADFDGDGYLVGFEFIDPLDVEINGEVKGSDENV